MCSIDDVGYAQLGEWLPLGGAPVEASMSSYYSSCALSIHANLCGIVEEGHTLAPSACKQMPDIDVYGVVANGVPESTLIEQVHEHFELCSNVDVGHARLGEWFPLDGEQLRHRRLRLKMGLRGSHFVMTVLILSPRSFANQRLHTCDLVFVDDSDCGNSSHTDRVQRSCLGLLIYLLLALLREGTQSLLGSCSLPLRLCRLYQVNVIVRSWVEMLRMKAAMVICPDRIFSRTQCCGLEASDETQGSQR